MSVPPAHIHLKSNAVPYAKHTLILVPFHCKQEVKELLDNFVKNGIPQEVSIDTPVQWCSTMVATAKKDWHPRITVDLQHLNSQCLQETHHTPSQFQIACQIPSTQYKKINFGCCCWFSCHFTQQRVSTSDNICYWIGEIYVPLVTTRLSCFNRCLHQKLLWNKPIPHKAKIVDNTLLYDKNIENAFFHVWDYLTLCAKNDIVINESKFKFWKDTVAFAGLKVTPSAVSPTDTILNAIQNFPQPSDITRARSWFGLINHVACAYSISPIMQPFC